MKYKLTENTKIVNGITLHQIQALKSFGNVKEGAFGGWIEKESNLSHDGDAWVYGDARVSELNHYMCFQSFGSVGRTTTVFKTKESYLIICGCFAGDLEAFEKAVDETHGDSQHGLEYKAIIEVIKLRVKTWA